MESQNPCRFRGFEHYGPVNWEISADHARPVWNLMLAATRRAPDNNRSNIIAVGSSLLVTLVTSRLLSFNVDAILAVIRVRSTLYLAITNSAKRHIHNRNAIVADVFGGVDTLHSIECYFQLEPCADSTSLATAGRVISIGGGGGAPNSGDRRRRMQNIGGVNIFNCPCFTKCRIGHQCMLLCRPVYRPNRFLRKMRNHKVLHA